jgi:hypothetical protein
MGVDLTEVFNSTKVQTCEVETQTESLETIKEFADCET